MGQYPSPYPYAPPPYQPGSVSPVPDPLKPVKRASIILIVVGLLVGLLGVCVAPAWLMSANDLRAMMEPGSKEWHIPIEPNMVEVAQRAYTILSIEAFIFGPALFIAGLWVRRASKVSIVMASVICFAFVGVEVASFVLGCAGVKVLSLIGCVGFIPAILLAVASVWLIKMLNALPELETQRQQWAAYYAAMQHQQTYGAYGQGGYGYPPPQGYGHPPVGYGTPPIPPTTPPQDATPPVRHPPLPPDEPRPPV